MISKGCVNCKCKFSRASSYKLWPYLITHVSGRETLTSTFVLWVHSSVQNCSRLYLKDFADQNGLATASVDYYEPKWSWHAFISQVYFPSTHFDWSTLPLYIQIISYEIIESLCTWGRNWSTLAFSDQTYQQNLDGLVWSCVSRESHQGS